MDKMFPDCGSDYGVLGTSKLIHTASVCKSLGTCDCGFFRIREIITVILWVVASVVCGCCMKDTSYRVRIVFWSCLMLIIVAWEFAICLVFCVGAVFLVGMLWIESCVWMGVEFNISNEQRSGGGGEFSVIPHTASP